VAPVGTLRYFAEQGLKLKVLSGDNLELLLQLRLRPAFPQEVPLSDAQVPDDAKFPTLVPALSLRPTVDMAGRA
jgi:hypothetical protein